MRPRILRYVQRARQSWMRGVSVVIPVKDDGAALRRVLADLTRQTVPPDEIVVVDNDSADDVSGAVAASGAIVIHEPEPGIPAAASAGYDAARYAIVARCDADSRLPPDWIERLVRAFEDPTIDAVTGPGRFYGAPPRLSRLSRPLSRIYMGLYRWTTGAALGHPPLFGSNLAMRRSAWADVRAEVHRSGTDIHDDLDLSFHLGRRHRIRWDAHLLVGISAAPLRGGTRRRLARGVRSVTLHWPQDLPPLRWARIAAGRAAAARRAAV